MSMKPKRMHNRDSTTDGFQCIFIQTFFFTRQQYLSLWGDFDHFCNHIVSVYDCNDLDQILYRFTNDVHICKIYAFVFYILAFVGGEPAMVMLDYTADSKAREFRVSYYPHKLTVFKEILANIFRIMAKHIPFLVIGRCYLLNIFIFWEIFSKRF